MRICELKEKEVINVCSGKRLGCKEVPLGWFSPEQLEELYLNSDLQTQSLYFPSQEPPETV